jgi:hypothetical protein
MGQREHSESAARAVDIENRALDLVALVAIASAWISAWLQVRGLTWPCENDLFRDLGAAQNLIDGGFMADPGFLGESWWYNPLVPAILALISQAFGVPLHVAYASAGPHLNLAAPVAFYAMVAILSSRRAAVASLVAFLFLGHWDLPSWLTATYSPWLWACNLAQAFFYAAIGCTVLAFRSRRLWMGAGAGALAGLTFLSHTAPALLLGGVVLAAAFEAAWSVRTDVRALRSVAVLALAISAAAVLVSSPFWWSIASYGATIRNATPLEWVASELEVGQWPALLRRELTLRGAFAIVGFVALIALGWPKRPFARSVLLGWLASALLGLGYGYARQLTKLPPLLPSWHFYFYLQAFGAVLFGLGAVFAAGGLATLLGKLSALRAVAATALERWTFVGALVALNASVLVTFGDYRKRTDIAPNRAEAKRFASQPTTVLYRWILNETRPNDVFLADTGVSFYAVQAAGRKVVALQDLFANPYVDAKKRERDAASMFRNLREGRAKRFLQKARRYRVKFVILEHDFAVAAENAAVLKQVKAFSHHRIYEIALDGGRARGRE